MGDSSVDFYLILCSAVHKDFAVQCIKVADPFTIFDLVHFEKKYIDLQCSAVHKGS